MGLSRTVSEIDGDFSRKAHNFPTPMYFAPPLKGFILELGTGAGGQKLEWWATGQRKKCDDIFSRLDTIHQRDGQTDGQTDTGRQGPRLRIASRGKNLQFALGSAAVAIRTRDQLIASPAHIAGPYDNAIRQVRWEKQRRIR